MPPVKVEIANSPMPAEPAAIMPVLTMPPPALTSENTATLPTRMPLPDFDAILPLLLMPPEKVDRTFLSSMPVPWAEIVLLLTMLPKKLATEAEVPLTATPTTMPLPPALILPLLLMPPAREP